MQAGLVSPASDPSLVPRASTMPHVCSGSLDARWSLSCGEHGCPRVSSLSRCSLIPTGRIAGSWVGRGGWGCEESAPCAFHIPAWKREAGAPCVHLAGSVQPRFRPELAPTRDPPAGCVVSPPRHGHRSLLRLVAPVPSRGPEAFLPLLHPGPDSGLGLRAASAPRPHFPAAALRGLTQHPQATIQGARREGCFIPRPSL